VHEERVAPDLSGWQRFSPTTQALARSLDSAREPHIVSLREENKDDELDRYAVIEIYKPPNPCYHFLFLYDDEDDTIGRQAHSTAIRGRHPNPAQIPNSNIRTIKKSLNPLKTNDKPKSWQ
jgi:hypothetical protein